MVEERAESHTFGEIADGLLASGLGFRFRARGRSMWPLIEDGEILHVQQANAAKLKVGEIVLFRQGREFKAHRIVRKQKDLFITRGDTGTQTDGAIMAAQIVGKIVAKECTKTGRTVLIEGLRARLRFLVREGRARVMQAVRRRIQFRVVLALLLLAIPLAARGQVALDASTSIAEQVTSLAHTVTLAHTPARSNRVLVVGVSMNISALNLVRHSMWTRCW